MKIESTQDFIREMVVRHKAPAVLSSFGKESMVMLHLLREMKLELPVIFHRDPWHPIKNNFADMIIGAWNLVVHDWPPSAMGIKVNGSLETVARYQVGPLAYFDIPKNIVPPVNQESFACGLVDLMARPKASFQHPWDVYLIGHKDCDVDPFEGPVPLKTDYVAANGHPALAFPLKTWSDEEVWRYLNTRRVPVQESRYDRYNGGKLREGHERLSNDYITACVKCIDPREPAKVLCPKTGTEVPNVSAGIYRFHNRPSYIERKTEPCLTHQE